MNVHLIFFFFFSLFSFLAVVIFSSLLNVPVQELPHVTQDLFIFHCC